MNALGYKKIKVVLDRGFFSASNVNELYKHHMKFLIAGKLSLKLVRTHVDSVRETMRNWVHYDQTYQLYAYCLPITWNYVQDRPYKGDTIRADRRMYLHLYFSPDLALENEKAFNNRLAQLQEELVSGTRHPDHEKQV
jgi:transposase